MNLIEIGYFICSFCLYNSIQVFSRNCTEEENTKITRDILSIKAGACLHSLFPSDEEIHSSERIYKDLRVLKDGCDNFAGCREAAKEYSYSAPDCIYDEFPLNFRSFWKKIHDYCKKKKINTSINIAITLIIIFIAGLIFYIVIRKRHKNYKNGVNPSDVENSFYYSMVNLNSDPILKSTRCPYRNLKFIEKVGNGTFGIVWKGKYHGKTVAIKKLNPEHIHDESIKTLVDEIKLMNSIPTHPNIVPFIGCSWKSSNSSLCAITKFIEGGDLRSLLDKKEISLPWKEFRFGYALQIALGLQYLHSHQVLHRDLKTRNVLVNKDYQNCYLTDFGLSRQLSVDETMTIGMGTVRWMAPELIKGEKYDYTIDIYAFGVVLNEIDTRQIPYSNIKSSNGSGFLSELTIANEVLHTKLRPRFSESCPQSIGKLAQACMDHNPNNRPRLSEVIERLNSSVWVEIMDMKTI